MSYSNYTATDNGAISLKTTNKNIIDYFMLRYKSGEMFIIRDLTKPIEHIESAMLKLKRNCKKQAVSFKKVIAGD